MKIDLSQYKAVIFDWDGTLVDTCDLVLDAHNHVRKHYGHAEWSMDDFLGQASKSAREYYPEVYGDKADEAQVILYEYVEKHHLNYLEPMNQAQEILETIDLPMALVSNKRHKFLHIEVEVMGWAHHFKSMIGAGHAEKDKPSPIPLLLAISEIDTRLKPSDILYVGDTETDILTAKNTGCDVVFIQSDKPRPDLIETYNPAFFFNDLKSFAEAVTVHEAAPNRQVV
jgi:phosphoglycolate phosphatase